MGKQKKASGTPKLKILTVEAVQWRINNQQGRWEAFGITLKDLKTEKTQVILRDRKCQFPGCLRKLEYFIVKQEGDKAYLSPICHQILGPGNTKRMPLTIDHKLARCLGGPDTMDNEWLMCEQHNQAKGRLEGSIYKILIGVNPGSHI